ncbi:doxx family protein [Roseivirga sp. E12]|uniref:doxx family protein n=1 Tax=Roseivirga sp. E12 TaxID=2819237 RepID=UPI001ABCC3C2|nr:doxx family protein [Roseivirga sp. E12]MBO3699253.1 doxx family protein [Roseivirga sp. E12]
MRGVVSSFLSKNQFRLLRYSIGILFVWFGMLKFFPGVSPAEGLATDTVRILSFGLLQKALSLKLLAILEVGLGLLLMFTKEYRITFWLLLFHMACTITPLFVLPEVTFKSIPFQLTIEGQYIIKNFVIISAAFVLLFAHKGQSYSE